MLNFLTVQGKIVYHIYKNPDMNLHNISKKYNITYAYILKILHMLESYDYVQTLKSGRERKVKFTSRGSKLANMIIDLYEDIKK